MWGMRSAALGIAAAGLGWQARPLDDLGTDQLETLLGVADPRGAEPEHPDCLVAVFPQRRGFQQWKLPDVLLDFFRPIAWQGQPSVLSPSHVEWRWAEAAAEIGGEAGGSGDRGQGSGVRRQGTRVRRQEPREHPPRCAASSISGGAREMDGQTAMERTRFIGCCCARCRGPGLRRSPCCPGPRGSIWRIFVDRVSGLAPGLYLLARDPAEIDALRRR